MSFWTANYWTSNFWTSNFWTDGGAPVISASVSGSLAGIYEDVVVSTGGFIDFALVNDTYIAAGTGPIGTIAQSQAFVDAITSAQVEAGGWNAQIRDVLTHTAITRLSDTVARFTVPATAGYTVTANETISTDIPNAILTISAGDLSAGSFQVNEGVTPIGGEGIVNNLTSDLTSDLVN